jgi:branched-chain amino acid aminotransferase
MGNKVWIRGKIIDEEDAVVNIMSPSAQFGLNVFEGIRGYKNDKNDLLYVCYLEKHIDRLLESCRLMGIVSSYSKDEIIIYFNKTILANKFDGDFAARIIIFGDGMGSWSSEENFSMCISPISRNRTSLNSLKRKSASITSWQRINDNALPPRAKVGANYINGRYAYLQAKNDGYDLPIFLGIDGKISESCGACLFIVKNKKLITPPVTASILESITRELIIQISKDFNLDVIERIIDRTEVYLADEVFLCGTAAEITPIIKIDRFAINNTVGKITLKLLEKYLDIVRGNDDKYSNYIKALENN